MKKINSSILVFILISTMACSYTDIPWASASIATPSVGPVLLFSIGVHVEPFGAKVSSQAGDFSAKPNSQKYDYHNQQLYDRHVSNLQSLAQTVESHGGVMTVQVQSPFTNLSIENQNPILRELSASGHELALHFHEDAHLGKMANQLSPEIWCAVMLEEMDLITQASGVAGIRYWSGGNLYSHLLEAAACAGLQVNSDWKNPETQQTDLALVGVNPWRPSGSSHDADVKLFSQHDPTGPVIFLPEGQYDREDFVSMKRSDSMGGDEEYFDYLEESLYASLEAADAQKVNVFHFTIHAGEFVGDPANPYALLDTWLAEVVDPLVTQGRVQWATFSQMADAFSTWEQNHTGEDPLAMLDSGMGEIWKNEHDQKII